MGWEMMVLLIVGGIHYKLKSIHIDFTGKDDDDENKKPKHVKSGHQRKQLKK
jgi:hypothetical protein